MVVPPSIFLQHLSEWVNPATVGRTLRQFGGTAATIGAGQSVDRRRHHGDTSTLCGKGFPER